MRNKRNIPIYASLRKIPNKRFIVLSKIDKMYCGSSYDLKDKNLAS